MIQDELKAELTYWKETANEWRDKYKEAESDLHYWQKYCLDLEKELNKSVDK